MVNFLLACARCLFIRLHIYIYSKQLSIRVFFLVIVKKSVTYLHETSDDIMII